MKEITDIQLIAHIEGDFDREIDRRIKKDADLKKRYDQFNELIRTMTTSATPRLPSSIERNINEAIHDRIEKKGRQKGYFQVAAVIALLVIGYLSGQFIREDGSNVNELAALREEVSVLKEITLTSALRDYSASDRILAVNTIEYTKSKADPELITTLVNTLNGDESANVRYAALQALKKFIDDENVRSELVKSLESQNDPLIQISLITILVEVEERSAIVPIRELSRDQDALPEVKQQAEMALEILI